MLDFTAYQFQSTRPIRGATTRKHKDFTHGTISIHAPHTGRDPWGQQESHMLP